MRRIWTTVFSGIGMAILILDTKTALSGALEGLELCIHSVIPSLFPFFVLSVLLTGSLNGTVIAFLKPLCRLVGVPAGAESVLVVGLLGGYPTGAQSVAQLYRDGAISNHSARRMLGFCSNAGPAFLFGIVAPQFSDRRAGWILWGIQILSALAVGALLPGKNDETVRNSEHPTVTLPAALKQSTAIMAQVCGWVIMFRVLITFLNQWILWLLPESVQIIICGLLELTNGCCGLNAITSEKLRFLCASVMLSFGGVCVFMQTASVTEGLGLGMYLPGKLMQTLISTALAAFLIQPGILSPVILVGIVIICIEIKKRSGNSVPVGV